jgi:aspartate racemase
MKRIGVLGGISAQATMDFEARVHRVSQQLIPQHWNHGYPPMVVWYHRRPPIRVHGDGRPVEPREIDPELVEAARWLGKAVDFIVIPCNAAHVGVAAIREAAGCPVLSMIDLAVDDVARRGWRRVGVTGFAAAPAVYLDPLRQRGVECATIDAARQAPLDAAIHAVAEGRDGAAHVAAARAAVGALRSQEVDGVVLGCTEIPLLLEADGPQPDLVNPAALLAEAAVRFAIDAAR